MEAQKVLKFDEKITIIADYRENAVINYLKKFAKVNVANLDVGDFICSENFGIERKNHADFISSIIDGRIFEQARDLKNSYEKALIIIEGHSNREISENALKAAIASLLSDFNVSMIQTKNPLDTAKTIYWIAKKEQAEIKKVVAFKVMKKSKEIKNLQESIVSSLPGISHILSKRLLKYFGNVKNVFSANEAQLKKVPGIGDKLAKKIVKTISANY